ncbi:MAG: hypothetical protein R3E31_01165 [Chloroflexota bacterium]
MLMREPSRRHRPLVVLHQGGSLGYQGLHDFQQMVVVTEEGVAMSSKPFRSTYTLS